MAGTNPLYLPQSEDLQRALFGYAVKEAKVYEEIVAAMEVVGDFGWISPFYTRLWDALGKLRRSLGKHPSEVELKNAPEVLNEEPRMRERLENELKRAHDARLDVDLTGLLRQLRSWQEAVLIDKKVTELARFYNIGDLPKAKDTAVELATKLEGLRDTLSSQFMTAPERAALEREERLSQASKVLTYGVSYYDEALGGIAPNDLVVVGAKTGSGKTQLVTQIALANASAVKGSPKRVSFFALEAENHEIERRIKYHLLTRAFIAKLQKSGQPLEKGLLNYADWRLGKLERELGGFEDQVQSHMSKYMENLRTYYRVSGHFGVQELEKSLVRAAKESDLIVLDHFHYVDTDGQNENAEAKIITKTLRDVVLGYGVPIVVVAHLRKTQGGRANAVLMPGVEDFHGSSDLVKIATTAILIGPARDVISTDQAVAGTYPTYMRVGKCRLDGSRLYPVGVGYFDPTSGRYRDKYAIGSFNQSETEWKCWDPERRPRWAKNGSLLVKTEE